MSDGFKLFPHQVEAQSVLRKMDREYNCGMLCDEMGMGKTITMATYLQENHIKGNSDLIVCPSSLLHIWKREMQRVHDHSPRSGRPLSVIIYHGKDRASKILEGDPENDNATWDYVITSYTLMRSDVSRLTQIKWGRMVLDESHMIKNGVMRKVTQLAAASFLLSSIAQSRFCITGTPFNNRISDVASQAKFMGAEPYCEAYWWRKNTTNRRALNEWRETFILKRTKEKMLALPSYTEIQVEPTAYESEVINTVKKETKKTFDAWQRAKRTGDNEGRMKYQGCLLSLILRLRLVSNSPQLIRGCSEEIEHDNPMPEKVLSYKDLPVSHLLETSSKLARIVSDIVKNVEADPRKGVVVFSQFTSFLDMLQYVFANRDDATIHPIETKVFSGKLSHTKRDGLVKWFNTSSHPRVIFISLQAGGTGLSLHHGSSTVMMTEPYYNPFAEKQAEERIHRIGQEHPVKVYRYTIADSVETWISSIKSHKLMVASRMSMGLPGFEGTTSDFKIEDIRLLFKTLVRRV